MMEGKGKRDQMDTVKIKRMNRKKNRFTESIGIYGGKGILIVEQVLSGRGI